MDSLLRSSIAKSVVLALDLATDLPRLWGDPVQLQQIVLNLVVNASEAIGDGGGRITIRSHAAGSGRVALEVSDDGPGMGEDTQRRAFDPFFSTKLAGRGLGLAVVQGNVRAHEGTVTLVSAQGRGTTIRIELPAAAGAGGDGDGVALKPRREAPEASPVKGHVLVVDDEPTVRAAVTSVLESAGLSVEAVADGLAATDAVARAPGTYAAVLLDLTMPGMDGRDTLQALKRLRGDLPVVVTSGYVDAAMDGRLAMADGVLPKPFDAATLQDAIRRAMRLARS
jgi:CheY-like chemotaxis protein